MELFKANHQWATRPQDERFKSMQEMHTACLIYKGDAREAIVSLKNLRVEANDNDIALVGKTGVPAKLTNWAMGQLSAKVGAPASYLRELPATLAVQNLNHGFKSLADENPEDTTNILFHQNGSLLVRSATSDMYSRIWNSDITGRLLQLQADNPNWKNPMAYANGKMGDVMEPAGLYASDHDMFAFLVDESKTLEGSPKGLNRGFFVWNSEVGASSFGVMTFLYDRVCGNNIVWGAQNVSEIRIRHVGTANEKAFRELSVELRKYADESASDTEAKIKLAKNYQLGATKDQALDALMGAIAKLRVPDLTRTQVDAGLKVAEQREARYGNPLSLWGAVGGITESSQAIPFADKRNKVDRAAGKLMQIAF